MPTYCYEDEKGKIHERSFSITAPIPVSVALAGGGRARRCYQAERASVQASAGWPMECVASGVNAAQAGELRACLARKGVPTEVTRDGNPVYRNALHRRKALRARGIVDRMSFI
jgi:hypothetical protein